VDPASALINTDDHLEIQRQAWAKVLSISRQTAFAKVEGDKSYDCNHRPGINREHKLLLPVSLHD
jgi:hypothetical protein